MRMAWACWRSENPALRAASVRPNWLSLPTSNSAFGPGLLGSICASNSPARRTALARNRPRGWLAYGAALNEGRALFAGDREFGQWKQALLSQVGREQPKADDEVAAMWAAANADDFATARDEPKHQDRGPAKGGAFAFSGHTAAESVTPNVTRRRDERKSPKRVALNHLVLLDFLAPAVGIEPTTN